MVDVARALMGLGAAVGGQAPQFRQQMMQEDELARKRAMEEEEMSRSRLLQDEEAAERRRKTMVLDAQAGNSFLQSGDY